MSSASDDDYVTSSMWAATIVSALPSFIFGYALAALNSCLVTGSDNKSAASCFDGSDSSCPTGTLYNDLELSTVEAQIATSLAILGAWIGSALGSSPSETFGRRKTLLFNNLLFIIGIGLTAYGSKLTLMAGRLILGVGVGVESVIVPVLLSEIASPQTRGKITTLHQAM
jgi:MFS family permease